MKKSTIKLCFFGTYDREYTSNRIVLQGLEENNVPVVEINAEVKLTKLISQQDMSLIQLIKRVLKKYRIFVEILKNKDALKDCNAIYVGFPGHVDVFLAYIIAKIFGRKLIFNPIVVIYTGFADDQGILKKDSLFGKMIRMAEKIVYALPDLVLADTPYQLEHLHKEFGVPKNKLRSLPLGADNKYYKYSPLAENKKEMNAVYYGLYTPLHGVEHIIEAANILRNDKDITFTFVGNGNTFRENFDRAKKLNLKNVKFFYDVPVEKHPAIIEKADIFFGFLQKHPSVERIIPNKVYQGFALGKVVVAADAAVMRSIFTHRENVYLCRAADPKDLTKTLLDLKTNPRLRKRIAENGYRLYLERFTPKAVGKQLIKFVQEIL